MTYRGFIDHISEGAIRGWVYDVEAPDLTLNLEVSDGNGNAILCCASQNRDDLKNSGIGDGRHGFDVKPPMENGGFDLASLRVRIVGTDVELERLVDLTPVRRLKRIAQRGVSTLKARMQERANRKSGTQPAPEAEEPIWTQDTLHLCERREREAALPFGKIAQIRGGQIQVWLDNTMGVCLPVLHVDGKPAWQDPKTTVLGAENQGMTRYDFFVSGIAAGSEVTLWAVMGNRVHFCESRKAPDGVFERSLLTQLTKAAEIAQEPDAVAITCWDSGHNPVGRAKVLLDVLKGRRPVAMFCFMFEEFGGDIWPPLSNLNDNIVTIPWAKRFIYLRAAAAMGLRFDTIWMCKPRAPTFQMAANIAHPNSKLILDMDDNEEHFSQSVASRTKAYGLPSIGLSRALMKNVKARTAASVSLVEDFDAQLVRHARKDARDVAIRTVPSQQAGGAITKVGFIGTVRPHKHIMQAAEAIQKLNQTAAKKFEFHVYGDVQPASLQRDLEAVGVVVKQNVPSHELSGYLRGMDIVLAGFHSALEADAPITKYQISSKIGDGLAVGRPVMAPSGPSVADLDAVPGIFLFTEDNFVDQLTRAQNRIGEGELSLAEEFTMDAAHKGFAAAEKVATQSPRAAQALSLVPPVVSDLDQLDTRPTLLLVWKQHDAGLYGRRIDLLCRSYRRRYPGHRIVVLEILAPDTEAKYQDASGSLSEKPYINALNTSKRLADLRDSDDVQYRQIMVSKSHLLHGELENFLVSNYILPTNAVVVLYPYITHLDRVYDLLQNYPLIVDVVDNQLAWVAQENRVRIIRQYFDLIQTCDQVVFNSALNFEYFGDNGFLPAISDDVTVIPNWYLLPKGTDQARAQSAAAAKDTFDVFYSGNMNDRIDWQLLEDIADLGGNLRLHLIGETGRVQEPMAQLLGKQNVIFHGVMSERMALHLLAQGDLTLLPHVIDQVSTYMNPLKVHMYAALGLETIATDIPGILASDRLQICPDTEAFLAAVKGRMQNGAEKKADAKASDGGQAFVELITAMRDAKAPVHPTTKDAK